jgi:hypothetical protein
MTTEDFDNALRTLNEVRPFRAFEIELNTGARVVVDRANSLATRLGVAVYLAAGGVPHLFNHDDVNQIVGDSGSTPSNQPEG